MGNALPFQLTEEAFTGCVVAAMPDCTHAADQRVAIRKALVVDAGELATAIRMQDLSPWRCQIAISTARITLCRS